MVWKMRAVEIEKQSFVKDWLSQDFNMTELCKRYNISRTTGHKLLKQYDELGDDAFYAKTKAPHHIPHKTPAQIEAYILNCKSEYISWGAVTIKAKLERTYPDIIWPAKSTIHEILQRHGYVKHREDEEEHHPILVHL